MNYESIRRKVEPSLFTPNSIGTIAARDSRPNPRDSHPNPRDSHPNPRKLKHLIRCDRIANNFITRMKEDSPLTNQFTLTSRTNRSKLWQDSEITGKFVSP